MKREGCIKISNGNNCKGKGVEKDCDFFLIFSTVTFKAGNSNHYTPKRSLFMSSSICTDNFVLVNIGNYFSISLDQVAQS